MWCYMTYLGMCSEDHPRGRSEAPATVTVSYRYRLVPLSSYHRYRLPSPPAVNLPEKESNMTAHVGVTHFVLSYKLAATSGKKSFTKLVGIKYTNIMR